MAVVEGAGMLMLMEQYVTKYGGWNKICLFIVIRDLLAGISDYLFSRGTGQKI